MPSTEAVTPGMRLEPLGLAVGVLALILADVFFGRAGISYGPSHMSGFVVAFLTGQVGLAAVWLAIGLGHWLMRASIASLLIAADVVCLYSWNRMSVTEFVPIHLVQAITVAGVLFALRAKQFRLVRVDQRDATAGLPQFSIRDVLLFTTLVAAVLAGFSYLRAANDWPPIYWLLGVLGFVFAAVTLASVAAALMFKRFAITIAVAIAVGIVTGWGIGTLLDRFVGQWIELLGVATVVQVALLAAIRQAGYRFERVARADPSMP